MSGSEKTLLVPTSRPPTPPLLPLPELDFRWVHAGAQHLDLLPTPITTASTSYKAFSYDESLRIEEAWWTLTEGNRRTAVLQWGLEEGEGAPAKVNAKKEAQTKEKEKEKEKEKSKEKERRDSGLRAQPLSPIHPIDEHTNGLPELEALRSGGEQTQEESADGGYKDLMQKVQKEYEDLELIAGVPVSQVGPPPVCETLTEAGCDRTRCSRFPYQLYHYIQRSGHILVRECRC